jgi:muramoyltetrapeptide carboxypeptidase
VRSDPVVPAPLQPGDTIRFVSPASTPDRDAVEASAALLEQWGLKVDYGPHAFRKLAYLAGTDEERLADLNGAIRDPAVRAIVATRGGKGSYRIADRLDFQAAKRDPKFLVGFSDITILQLALIRNGICSGIHGSLTVADRDGSGERCNAELKALLMGTDDVVLSAQGDQDTGRLTNGGTAEGPLVGGNLPMVATAAGWALPPLRGCILLLEAIGLYLGEIDRQLTMLRKGGHLDGVAGIALGRFTDCPPSGRLTVVDVLGDHLERLGVPLLGGLPLGHGASASAVPVGLPTLLDGSRRCLSIRRGGGAPRA